MKKIALILGLLILNLFAHAQDSISPLDQYLISQKLKDFVSAVNTKNYETISSLVSSDNPNLITSMQKKIKTINEYVFEYDFFDGFIEEENGKKRVKIIGKYQKPGINNKLSWASGYFTFEKQGDNWCIVETDFCTDIGWPFILFTILLIPIVAFLPIAMLIDCAKHPVKNKAFWVFFLHFFNIIAAVPYYFFIRRNRKKIKPQSG